MYTVTIVIPIYNVALYLEQCLDSIVNQVTEEIEILCIEDGSNDGSKEILVDYAKKHPEIKVIMHLQNKGLSAARNTGIYNAHGEYIMFVDSDDFINPGALEVIISSIKNKNVDILTYNYEVVIENELYKEKKIEYKSLNTEYKEYENGIEWLIEKNKANRLEVTACSKVYRKKMLIENSLFFVDSILHEDVPFFFEVCLKAGGVKDITAKCYTYRRREGSITSKKSRKSLESYIIIYRRLEKLLYNNIYNEDIYKIIDNYIQNILLIGIENLMYYFNDGKMNIGNIEDQIIFDVFRRQLFNKNKWVRLSAENIAQIQKAKEIFVYGAGTVAIELKKNLDRLEIPISAFVVSNEQCNSASIGETKIITLEQFKRKAYKNYLMLIAVSQKYYDEIVNKLENNNITNFLYVVNQEK